MRHDFACLCLTAALALVASACDRDKDDETSTTSTTTTSGTTTDATASTTTGSTTGSTTAAACMSDAECPTDYTCKAGECVYDPSFWVIGEDGAVLRVNTSGEATPHPFAGAVDLRAIACHGSAHAWIVGDGGFAAHTGDGGHHWEPIDLGVTADLLAVEIDHEHAVWIAGADGALVRSDLHGAEPAVIAGASGTLRGVGVRGDGGLVIAVGEDGTIWRGDAAGVTAAATLGAPLRGAFVTPSGEHAAVVGDGGLLALSASAGLEWELSSGTGDSDLHAVQVASDGSIVIAAGDHGTIVRIEGGELRRFTAGAADLRALHVDAAGHGAAVGRGGALLITGDAGRSFAAMDLGELAAADLLGVDALGDEHL